MEDPAWRFVSPPISTGEFRQQCLEAIGIEELSRPVEDLRGKLNYEELGIPEGTCNKLQERECPPRHFKGPIAKTLNFETGGLDTIKFPENIPLQTLQVNKLKLGKMRQANSVPLKFSKQEMDFIKRQLDVETDDSAKDDHRVAPDDVITTVAICHPTNLRRTQDYQLLQYQKLTDLRDVIECLCDETPIGVVDTKTPPDVVQASRDVYKSAYFFIEGVFYNDMRDPLNRDLSKSVIDWAKSGNRYQMNRLGVFTSARMEDTRVQDLKVRLGYPYLYCHQGNCQHHMVFMDMRMSDPQDEQLARTYPVQTFQSWTKQKTCPVCDTFRVSWVTFNDIIAFEEPGFFCSKCFDYLHYSEDNKKLYEFDAYPFDGIRW